MKHSNNLNLQLLLLVGDLSHPDACGGTGTDPVQGLGHPGGLWRASLDLDAGMARLMRQRRACRARLDQPGDVEAQFEKIWKNQG